MWLTSGSNALLLLIKYWGQAHLQSRGMEPGSYLDLFLVLILLSPWVWVLWFTAGPLALYIGVRALTRAQSDSEQSNLGWWFAVAGVLIASLTTVYPLIDKMVHNMAPY